MANLSISELRERIFNGTRHEKTVARSSNPFAGTSFKGNVLTADVFETKKPSITEKVTSKSKLMYSALVGSIAGFGQRINSGVESIVSFCGRMRDGVAGFWNKMNDIEISLDLTDAGKAIKSRWDAMQDEHTVQKYMTLPVGKTDSGQSLESMLISEIGLDVAA